MVLVDAGAETQMGYAGDMTSTIPADRRFTPRQKAVYDVQVARTSGCGGDAASWSAVYRCTQPCG